MPRMRTIKPEFFTNEDLAVGDPLLALLFAGLWCWADRAGRLEDRPTKLHIAILPRRDCDVDALLAELARLGFIVRYAVDGVRVIQIVKFARHQNPHKAEKPSKLPPEGGQGAVTAEEPAKNGTSPVLAPDTPDANHHASRAGHESWAMGSGPWGAEPEEQTVPAVDTHGDSANRRAPVAPPEDDFAAWWTAYPRHEAKRPARTAYLKRKATGRSAEALLAAARHYAQHHELGCTPTEKIAHAATFLGEARDEEWEHGPPDQDRAPPAKAWDRNGTERYFADYRSAAEKAANPTRAWRQTWEPAPEDPDPQTTEETARA